MLTITTMICTDGDFLSNTKLSILPLHLAVYVFLGGSEAELSFPLKNKQTHKQKKNTLWQISEILGLYL